MKIKSIFFLTFCITAFEIQPTQSLFDPTTEIAFGISGSFTGHFGYYGNAIKHGVEAYFKQVNAQGGIHGKKLTLIALEDNGDAQMTKKNIETMMEQKVSMFIGVMGTRGILSVLPLIQQKKIALFFPWGGHQSFRDAGMKNIINGPGLLEPQLDALANYAVDTLKLKNIAIFHADDDFSMEGASYLQGILKKAKDDAIDVQSYNRFTMNIQAPTSKLIEKNPRVVISIGTSKPVIKMINRFFASGSFGTQFLGTEGTFLVPDIMKAKGVAFKYSCSVPDPNTSKLQIAHEYKQAMAKFFAEDDLSTLSFTYYVCGSIIGAALQQLKGTPTQEEILKSIEGMKNIDIKGFPVNFDSSNRHAFGKQVWII